MGPGSGMRAHDAGGKGRQQTSGQSRRDAGRWIWPGSESYRAGQSAGMSLQGNLLPLLCPLDLSSSRRTCTALVPPIVRPLRTIHQEARQHRMSARRMFRPDNSNGFTCISSGSADHAPTSRLLERLNSPIPNCRCSTSTAPLPLTGRSQSSHAS